MKITLKFEEAGEGATRLVSYSAFASPEDLQKVLEMGMQEGLTETYDKLEEYLEKN